MRHRLFHLRHRAPVGLAAIELLAGAAMHGDGLDAQPLRPGPRSRARCGFDRPSPAASSRSRAAMVAFTAASISRAASSGSRIRAEPDSAPVTSLAGQPMLKSMMSAPASSASFAPLAIHSGVRPTKLDHHQGQAVADGGAAHHIGAAAGEGVAGHHLGGDIGRAAGRGDAPERQVGHPRHGRGQHPAGNGDVTDLKACGHGRGRYARRPFLSS